MRSFLLTLAALVACSGPALAAPIPKTTAPAAQYALDFVCEKLQVDCSDVATPVVVFRSGWGSGQYGAYYLNRPGEVHLNAKFWSVRNIFDPDPLGMSVLIHEVTHLVHQEVVAPAGGLTRKETWYQPRARCTSESMAWSLGHQYLLAIGRADLALWNWRSWYGCTKEGFGDHVQ